MTYPPEGHERTTIKAPTHGKRALILPGVLTAIALIIGIIVWILHAPLEALAQEGDLDLFMLVMLCIGLGSLFLRFVLVWIVSKIDSPLVWYLVNFKHALKVWIIGSLMLGGMYFFREMFIDRPMVCLLGWPAVYLLLARYTSRKYAHLLGIQDEYYGCYTRQTPLGTPMSWDDVLLPLLIMMTGCLMSYYMPLYGSIGLFVIAGAGGVRFIHKTEKVRGFAMYDPNNTSSLIEYGAIWLKNGGKTVLTGLNWFALACVWLGIPVMIALMLPGMAWKWWACGGCVLLMLVPMWNSRIKGM